MTEFIHNSISYASATLVAEHLNLLDTDGYITYHHHTWPIPNTISKILLNDYKNHLNLLRHKGPAFSIHETDTPYGNYFMIYKMDPASLTAGKADVKQKANTDADQANVPRDWPSR